MEFITTADIANREITIPWGTFGQIVDIRTYRRWLPELKRRESALERWMRVINYNLSLVSQIRPYEELRQEALLMLDKFSKLQADTSGRTKWVGGTLASTKDPVGNFNCSFLAVNSLEAFDNAFTLLMNGCGVGFRVFKSDISQLPPIINKVNLTLEKYKPLHKSIREEFTHDRQADYDLYVEVGDSKEGWVKAIALYFKVLTNHPDYTNFKTIHYNFDSVRPMGERLKGFGGAASGPDALRDILIDIQRVVEKLPEDRLRSIDCMDIICAIAKGVVAGSVRRSALISLFEQGDDLCANAKVGLYTNPDLAHKSYRAQSNNTVCLTSKPTLEEIKGYLHTCKTEGEPGFNNYSAMVSRREVAAKLHRPNNPVEWYTSVGTNPCSEILLSTGKDGKAVTFCNLTTLPLTNFVIEGYLDYENLEQCLRLNVRSSLRQTCVEFNHENWTETQSDERLLGVSITGCQDAFSLLGWKTGSNTINSFLTAMNKVANDEAAKYAQILGVPRPLLVCAIKPEGTASTIYGCSSGLHWDWAPYYLRRVRMNASDALSKTLLSQGFYATPELYDLTNLYPDGDSWDKLAKFNALDKTQQHEILSTVSTAVFEFPVKSYSDRTQSEVGAIEQLESLKAFSKHYCDHMASCTITVKDDEWDDVADWIDNNWEDYLTASFFPYFNAAYPLLPNEAITEEEYKSKLSLIPDSSKVTLMNGRIIYKVDEDVMNEFEALLDTSDADDLLGSDCASGACPIR
jgi:adenosylcobalamin-dependent ribonucleoside-triphosphate reductase